MKMLKHSIDENAEAWHCLKVKQFRKVKRRKFNYQPYFQNLSLTGISVEVVVFF